MANKLVQFKDGNDNVYPVVDSNDVTITFSSKCYVYQSHAKRIGNVLLLQALFKVNQTLEDGERLFSINKLPSNTRNDLVVFSYGDGIDKIYPIYIISVSDNPYDACLNRTTLSDGMYYINTFIELA